MPYWTYEHAWQHFAHAVIANYSDPCRQGQSQEDVPECDCHRLVFDQEQSIQEEALLTETTATSPATANRSVTAAEQRRPLYVPNTKNNRNSTRPYFQNQQGSSNHDHEPFVDLLMAHYVTAPLQPVM